MNSIFIQFFLILASTSSESSSENIVYPDDAGVIDVTRASYTAMPNEALEAPAIQRALSEHISGTHVFYFPNGIYDTGSSLLKLAAGHRTASVVSNPCQHVSMSAAWKTKRDNQPAV